MDELSRQAMRKWTLAQPSVSAFVLSVVRNPDDRDDVLQDIAVAVIEGYGAYDPTRPFVPWAMGVARNKVRMYLRSRRRDRLVFDDETVNALVAAFVRASPGQSRRMDFLQDCLARLRGRARRLCDLRYQQGLNPGLIAEQLEMSVDAVKKALQRVRDQLRECINQKAASEGVSR